MIPVAWYTSNLGVGARGYWDGGLLEALFARDVWRPVGALDFEHLPERDTPEGDGCVLVVPARMQDGDPWPIQRVLDRLDWCLLILTSDEESTFPADDLDHGRLVTWVQNPRPALHRHHRPLIQGWPPDAPRLLPRFEVEANARPLDWVFAGQVTHDRRRDMADALATISGGQIVATDTFAAGLPYPDYLRLLASAKLAPCPSGPVHPDSFRTYEALEAGCVPLVDARATHGKGGTDGYWPFLFGDTPPFPVVEDWTALPSMIADELDRWPGNAVRCSAWWQGTKRDLVYRLDDTVRDLAGLASKVHGLADLITVLIPTSPIPSHPDTKIIGETVDSIRSQPGFADVEILILADGVRAEQADRADAYSHYLRRLCWQCEHEWPQTLPIVHQEHQHQARMTRFALHEVRTPLVLFAEHDCPLDDDIAWGPLCAALLSGGANLVRFHHEAAVHPEHEYLMPHLGEVDDIEGAPLIRCAQWSQRPHLARADYYRRILTDHFGPDERTFIEDRLHGVVASAWLDDGDAGWERHRLFMYAPPGGSIRRSRHLDGRDGDPKWIEG